MGEGAQGRGGGYTGVQGCSPSCEHKQTAGWSSFATGCGDLGSDGVLERALGASWGSGVEHRFMGLAVAPAKAGSPGRGLPQYPGPSLPSAVLRPGELRGSAISGSRSES